MGRLKAAAERMTLGLLIFEKEKARFYVIVGAFLPKQSAS